MTSDQPRESHHTGGHATNAHPAGAVGVGKANTGAAGAATDVHPSPGPRRTAAGRTTAGRTTAGRTTARRTTARRVGGIAGVTFAVLVPLGFLGLFFVYPVMSIIGRGFTGAGTLRNSSVWSTVQDPATWRTLWFTVWQAALSTAVTLVVGLPIASVYARVRFPGRGLFAAFVTIPFVLPTVVVAAAFRALGVGRGLGPILAAHVFFNIAVIVRTVGTAWASIDPRPASAARTLGARPLGAWRVGTWPRLRAPVAAATTIVFLFCFTSFGVILLLGGPTFHTLETEIYRQWAQRLDLGAAAALSIVQLVTVGLVLVVSSAFSRRAAGRAAVVGDTRRTPRGVRQRVAVGAVLGGTVVILGAPMVALLRAAFDTPTGYGLANFRTLGATDDGRALFVPVADAIRNSLVIAVQATVIAVVVGGLASLAIAGRSLRRAEQVGRPLTGGTGRRTGAAGRKALDVFTTLPLGISAVTVGFGFLVALDSGWLDLRTSPWLIPIAHALIGIPFVVRTMVPALRAIDVRLHEAAAVLGASPAKARVAVDLPIARRALLVAAGFAFAISLGEFGATLFIVRPDRPTLPVAIYRLLSVPGAQNYGRAMAAGAVLMLITATAMVLIERVRVPGAGSF